MNPKERARDLIVDVLADVGAPVHKYPHTASGRCVALVGASIGPRGHVDLTVRVQVDSSAGLGALEELEWKVLSAIRATRDVGWAETVTQAQDSDAQITYTEFTTTTRP